MILQGVAADVSQSAPQAARPSGGGVSVVEGHVRQRAVARQLDVQVVHSQAQFEFGHLHPVVQGRGDDCLGVEVQSNRLRLARREDVDLDAQRQVVMVQDPLEVPLAVADRCLGVDHVFEPAGQTGLGPDDFDLGGRARFDLSTCVVQLVLGELVLLAAYIQLATGRVELPVDDVNVPKNGDGGELRANVRDVLLIGRDPNRVRVDPRAGAPEQRLNVRDAHGGAGDAPDVVGVVIGATERQAGPQRTARCQRDCHARFIGLHGDGVALVVQFVVAVPGRAEERPLELGPLLVQRLLGDRGADQMELQVQVVRQRSRASLFERQLDRPVRHGIRLDHLRDQLFGGPLDRDRLRPRLVLELHPLDLARPRRQRLQPRRPPHLCAPAARQQKARQQPARQPPQSVPNILPQGRHCIHPM